MNAQERIAGDPLAMVIQEVTVAMKTDFGRQYQSQFKTDEDLRQYKRRLYTKLRDFDINDVADGYEIYVNSNKGFCPTIPEFIACVEQAEKESRRRREAEIEVARVAALPPPTVQCNSAEMLRQAKAKPKGDLQAALKNHDAVLKINSHNIKSRRFGPEHSCAIGFCQKAGALSHNTKGGGPFYCLEHYRQAG